LKNGTVAKVVDYFDAHPEIAEAKTTDKAVDNNAGNK
ncbi:MAG TPA: phosphate acetyltransferase PlsX, partial [Lactobacillus sp.]|nr:phosphate acetyltransferase PlsX [Lactobacillus sp.]